MPPAFRTAPEHNVAQRRQLIFSATCFTILCAFILSLLIGGAMWIPMLGERPVPDSFAAILVLPFYLAFTSIIWVPAFLIVWPIASLALRLGVAGWATAVAASMILFTLLYTGLTQPFTDVGALLTGAALGAVFGAIYWYGAYRSYPKAFDSRLPESF